MKVPAFMLIASAALLFSACIRPQKPTFKGVDNIHIQMDDSELIHVTGDAIFHNPNNMDIHVTGTNIEVFIDKIPAGKLERSYDVVLTANSESALDVEVDLPTDKVFTNPLQMLGGALLALGGKTYEVQFVGTVAVEAGGITWNLPIDQTEDVSLMQ